MDSISAPTSSVATLLTNVSVFSRTGSGDENNLATAHLADKHASSNGALLCEFLLIVGSAGASEDLNFYRDSCDVRPLGEGIDYRVEALLSHRMKPSFAIKYAKSVFSSKQPNEIAAYDDSRRLRKMILELRVLLHPPVRQCKYIMDILAFGWDVVSSGSVVPCLAVEYSMHGNMRQFLITKANHAPDDRYLLWRDVARGLDVLHACDIVHGDIKMENVLIFNGKGKGEVVAKLSDFGSSIIGEANVSDSQLCLYWGTSRYNPPEIQLQGNSQSGARIRKDILWACDVYALGMLTWENFMDGARLSLFDPDASLLRDAAGDPQQLAAAHLACVENVPEETTRQGRIMIESTLSKDPTKRSKISTILKKLEIVSETSSMKQYYPVKDTIIRGQGNLMDLTFRDNLFFAVVGSSRMFDLNSFWPWAVQQRIFAAYEVESRSPIRIPSYLGHLSLSICYYTGLGVDIDLRAVLHHMAEAAKGGCIEAILIIPQLEVAFGMKAPDHTPRELDFDHPRYRKHIEILSDATTRKPYTTPFRALNPNGIQMFSKKLPMQFTGLHGGSYYGHIDEVEKQLAKGERDFSDDEGRTALLLACGSGFLNVVSLLIQHGSNALLADKLGRTPLHMLIMFDEVNVAEAGCLLLQSSPKPDLEAATGQVERFPDFWDMLEGTPLEWAVRAGNVSAVRFFVEAGASPFRSINVATSLHRHDLLEQLLQSPMLKTDSEKKEINPFFYLAGAHPFRRLLMHGSDHATALSKTVHFLRKHWDFGRKGDPHGIETIPIDYLAAQNLSHANSEMLVELLELSTPDHILGKHVLADAVLGCRNSPLNSHARIVSILLSHNCPVDGISPRHHMGYNAFHFAIATEAFAAADLILAKRPDMLNSRTKGHGETPLHIAVRISKSAVEYLLSKGADPNATSVGRGMSALIPDTRRPGDHTPLGIFINEGLVSTRREIFPVIMAASRPSFIAIRTGSMTKNALHLATRLCACYPKRSGTSTHDTLNVVLENPEMREKIDAYDGNGFNALLAACYHGGYAAARILLEADADPSVKILGGPQDCIEVAAWRVRAGLSGRHIPINKPQQPRIDPEDAYKLLKCLSDHLKLRGATSDPGFTDLHLAAWAAFPSAVQVILRDDPAQQLMKSRRWSWTPRELLLQTLELKEPFPKDVEWERRAREVYEILLNAERS